MQIQAKNVGKMRNNSGCSESRCGSGTRSGKCDASDATHTSLVDWRIGLRPPRASVATTSAVAVARAHTGLGSNKRRWGKQSQGTGRPCTPIIVRRSVAQSLQFEIRAAYLRADHSLPQSGQVRVALGEARVQVHSAQVVVEVTSDAPREVVVAVQRYNSVSFI